MGPRPFRFISMWPSQPNFEGLVARIWKEHCSSPPLLLEVMMKLKKLKMTLKDWNKTIVAIIHLQANLALAHLLSIQNRITDKGYSESLSQKEVATHMTFDNFLTHRIIFLEISVVQNG